MLLLALAAAIAAAEMLIRSGAATREAGWMAGIFVLAATLWITEALPLFATSLLVIGLQIVVLANPGGWPGLGFEARPSPSYRDILNTAADPVHVAVSIALIASMSMALPVSTPPNAMAYARGEFSTRDMVRVSLVIIAVATVAIIFGGGAIMRFWGMLD